MDLGSNLQALRKAKGLSQEALAEAAGVSLTQVSKIERNETDPRATTVVKLAKALDCSVDKLMLGIVPGGLNGKLREALERAQRLRPRDRGELISVIHKYCTASVLMEELVHDYDAEAQRRGMDPDELEHLQATHAEQQEFEEYMDYQDRAEIDALVGEEEVEQAVEKQLKRQR
tara:strand:- start:776 stop:1297 length:522 start_codon:yes stop_codon:yes gene_type:complete